MTKTILIPGPAQAILAEALKLASDATLGEMVDEIARLTMAACEGSAKKKRAKKPVDSEWSDGDADYPGN